MNLQPCRVMTLKFHVEKAAPSLAQAEEDESKTQILEIMLKG